MLSTLAPTNLVELPGMKARLKPTSRIRNRGLRLLRTNLVSFNMKLQNSKRN